MSQILQIKAPLINQPFAASKGCFCPPSTKWLKRVSADEERVLDGGNHVCLETNIELYIFLSSSVSLWSKCRLLGAVVVQVSFNWLSKTLPVQNDAECRICRTTLINCIVFVILKNIQAN